MPRPNRALSLLAVVVVVVTADVLRRHLASGPGAPVPVSTDVPAPGRSAVSAVRGPTAAVTGSAGIDTSGTFLGAMLIEMDSLLRRWPDTRRARPLRVAVARSAVEGYRERFPESVAWAVGRWDGVTPVGLVTDADTADADIIVSWVARLDGPASGRTELTWNQFGEVRRAVVVLATHTADGRAIDDQGMSALALHELGHALGLGHSTERRDVMYPVATALELSERDLQTVRRLYALPPGSGR